MKHITFFLFISIVINTLSAQNTAHLKKELDRVVYYDAEVAFKDTPGFIVGIIIGDSTYVYSYGSIEKGKEIKPTDQHVFEIGGASKVYTAMLVDQLVAEGKLSYEDDIAKYISDFKPNQTTIHQLITHTSGLPRMPKDFALKELKKNDPFAYYSKKDLFDFYKNFKFIKKAEDDYLYSNVNYALLEYIIEAASNEKFEDLLQQKVLQPLNLNASFISHTPKDIAFANGYTKVAIEVEKRNYNSFGASAGMKSNMEDLLQLMNFHLDENHPLQWSSFHQMHEPLYPTDLDDRSHIARGWHVIKNKKYPNVNAHSGSTSGHRMFMGFVKETKTAVVVLANSEKGTNGLGYLTLKMINNYWKKKKNKRLKM